jgi:hypothetical protein
MPNESPEPLWREVVGDPEPWRKGRIILVSVALVNLLLQALSFFIMLLTGVERALSLGVVLVLWWLMFAFIWFGTHWLRWLLGGYALLIGFVEMIWAFTDETPVRFIGVLLNFGIGAALFAPSVHFFAVRQRERIRWPEKLAVAAVFLLLLGSFVVGLIGFALNTAVIRQEADRYGTEALQRLFVDKDTQFLYDAATPAFTEKYGQGGLSALMARKYMHTGEVRDLRVVDSRVRTHFSFPARVEYGGPITAEGLGECGPVRVGVEVQHTDEGWKVRGFWWKCLNL